MLENILAFIGDISDVAVISVGGVGHLLDSAIGQSDSVWSLDIAGTIGGLLSVEVRLENVNVITKNSRNINETDNPSLLTRDLNDVKY